MTMQPNGPSEVPAETVRVASSWNWAIPVSDFSVLSEFKDRLVLPGVLAACRVSDDQLSVRRLKGMNFMSEQITGRAREELAAAVREEYEQGASIRVIAAAHGRSYGFVYQLLTESGITLRGRGGARSRR